jgi:DNA-binding GntR family transcriptional regulator
VGVVVNLVDQRQEMLIGVAVDWGSDVPVPEQIANTLRSEIRDQYRPGDALPRLDELAERFGVSRGSVTRALRILRDERVIGGRGSRGLVVLPPPP